jgi:hypothetical protein
MKVQLQIDAPIQSTEFVTDITFSDTIMVSLDCYQCSRCRRSVVVNKSGYFSYCTPTQHNFKGKILELKSTKDNKLAITTGHYLIEYEFFRFTDAKYPMRIPAPGSDWARVKFTLRCRCGANSTHETQNNQVRPFDILCECGAILVTEIEEIPKIQNASSFAF